MSRHLNQSLLRIKLREKGEHSRIHSNRVSLLKIQCVLQEGRHPIYRYECLGEQEMKERGSNSKMLQNLGLAKGCRTMERLLEGRSRVMHMGRHMGRLYKN